MTEKFSPRDDQKKAIKQCIKKFKSNNRGRAFLPTGYGKSLTMMWLHDQLGGNRLCTLVPSIQLVSQMAKDYAGQGSFDRLILVCCDSKAGVEAKKVNSDIEVIVTTDAQVIRKHLKQDGRTALVSTYASVEKLCASFGGRGSAKPFDLCVYDEAHRTAGFSSDRKLVALDKSCIKSSRRIFCTATPRVLGEKSEEDRAICMNDNGYFGPVFTEMPFEEAIRRGLLCDYKIVVNLIPRNEVIRDMRSRGRRVTEKSIAQYAVESSILKTSQQYGCKRVIAFAQGIDNSKALTRGLKRQHSDMVKEGLIDGKITTGHVDCHMNLKDRAVVIDKFKQSDNLSVLSNTRLLGTGFDVKSIDSVAFIQPAKSPTDVAQRVGRALRIDEGKELAYIILPILVNGDMCADADCESVIKGSDLEPAFETILALKEMDKRIESTITKFSERKEESDSVEGGEKEEKSAIVSVETSDGVKAVNTSNFNTEDLPVIEAGENISIGNGLIEFTTSSDSGLTVDETTEALQHVTRAILCKIVGGDKDSTTHEEAIKLLADECRKTRGWVNPALWNPTYYERWRHGAGGYPKLKVKQIKSLVAQIDGCEFLLSTELTHEDALKLLASDCRKAGRWLSPQRWNRTIAARWLEGLCGFPELNVKQIRKLVAKLDGCDFLKDSNSSKTHAQALSALAKACRKAGRWVGVAGWNATYHQRWNNGHAGFPKLTNKQLRALVAEFPGCEFLKA